jgi:hypothetical protein
MTRRFSSLLKAATGSRDSPASPARRDSRAHTFSVPRRRLRRVPLAIFARKAHLLRYRAPTARTLQLDRAPSTAASPVLGDSTAPRMQNILCNALPGDGAGRSISRAARAAVAARRRLARGVLLAGRRAPLGPCARRDHFAPEGRRHRRRARARAPAPRLASQSTHGARRRAPFGTLASLRGLARRPSQTASALERRFPAPAAWRLPRIARIFS